MSTDTNAIQFGDGEGLDIVTRAIEASNRPERSRAVLGDPDGICRYRVTVKHDNGLVDIIVAAQNMGGAIRVVMEAEGCPRSAILRVHNIT